MGTLGGFYDHSQPEGGPVTGSGPGFALALEKFEKRQKALGEVGIWRAVSASWTRNKGTFIDRDWSIIDYG